MLRDYLALRPLGSGATGIVFLATPTASASASSSSSVQPPSPPPPPLLLAIKAFRRSRDHDLRRARNEELILSKLLHASSRKPAPFLPRLHSAFDHGDFRFVVLDYCAGGDLNALRQSLPEGRFSTAAIRFYAAEIVLALERLHEEGIVYRDLKPENILLSADGHIMLTDFDLSVTLPPKKPSTPSPPLPNPAHPQGLQQVNHSSVNGKDDYDEEEEEDGVASMASCIGGCTGGKQRNRLRGGDVENRSRRRVVPAPASIDNEGAYRSRSSRGSPPSSSSSSAAEVRSNSFVGTEEYIAPEVILGTGHDFGVDWWGLGVLLYEMAYACTPFPGKTPKQTFHNILHQEPRLVVRSMASLTDLISQLLVKDPLRRLGSRSGATEIKAHPFFSSVQWDSLQDVMRPPFIPLSEPPLHVAEGGFDLTEHLVQVECARSEARAKRRLQRKQAS